MLIFQLPIATIVSKFLGRPKLPVLILAAALGVMAPQVASAQVYNLLHQFGGTASYQGSPLPDGINPGSVVFDSYGNMYGTSQSSSGTESVWEVSREGVYTMVHAFGGLVTSTKGFPTNDGITPGSKLTADSHGSVYGLAKGGGLYGNGLIFMITKSGTYLDYFDIPASITYANGSVGTNYKLFDRFVIDGDGNLFGATSGVGPNSYAGYAPSGFLWELTKSKQLIDLHDFGGTVTNANGSTGPDGAFPNAIAMDTSGNLYGTTSNGGPIGNGDSTTGMVGDGMLWKYSTSTQTYTDLHDFGGTALTTSSTTVPDGFFPESLVAIDSSGNLYGTCYVGGANGAYISAYNAYYGGMVWKFNSAGYTDLHDFYGNTTNADQMTGPDGYDPYGDVCLDASGNLFSTTYYGGAEYDGMVWEITSNNVYTDLHDFGLQVTNSDGTSVTDGVSPVYGVTLDGLGSIFGTTSGGGFDSNEGGTFWRLSPQSSFAVSLPASTQAIGGVFGGNPITGTVVLGSPAPDGGEVLAVSSDTSSVTGTEIFVPFGHTTASFSLPTTTVSAATTANLTVSLGAATPQTFSVPIIGIQSLALTHTSVPGDASANGTVTLTGPAPNHGVFVTMSSPASQVSFVQPTVYVAPGGTITNLFKVNTVPVLSDVVTNIQASVALAGGASATLTTPFTILAPELVGVHCIPKQINAGQNVQCQVNLSGAVPTGSSVTVTISSNNSAVQTQQIVVTSGSSQTRTFSTSFVGQPTDVLITATYNGVSHTCHLTLLPPP